MSKHLVALLLVVGSVILPTKAYAAVVFNEIAWMGSLENANAEWIELFNNGSEAVSLSGWTITSAGTAPTIALTGTISANGYYLLERTSDASVPGVSAHQVYTGALANGGDTLTLKDSIGGVSDTVVGGTGWSLIGGNNTTKETPQRSDAGWVTGTPTPGALNMRQTNTEEESDTNTNSESTTATTTPTVLIQGSVHRTLPTSVEIPRLYIDAGPSRIVQREVPALFEALAYDKYGSKRDARVSWSFGNGESLPGKSLWYTYHAPGTYTVAVRGDDGKKTGLALVQVQVVDALVTLKEMTEYGVVVENESEHMIDFSQWLFVQGTKTFSVPNDTVLKGHGVVTFTYTTLGLSPYEEVELHYPTGVVASTSISPSAKKPDTGSSKLLLEQEEIELPISIHTHEPHTRAPATRNSAGVAGAYMPAPTLFQETTVLVSP
jgi:hypothetical protein